MREKAGLECEAFVPGCKSMLELQEVKDGGPGGPV